ncbi:MAG: energy-coupling factor ABC transporter permease [Candidatus Nanopelagicales bacterium]
MHIPDGFIAAPVAAGAALVSVAAVAVAVRGARRTLDDRTAPLAGLVAVFVFAAQMINFPVGAGTSGHLIGAALAAILVGPYAGMLALTVVLVVQALLFADGGLTALGLNVLNLAVIAPVVAWFVFVALVRIFGSGKSAVLLSAGVAGFVSVLAAVAGFVVEFALGGTVPVDLSSVIVAMFSIHTLIAIVEGVITALIVWSVAAVRPDLVAGLRRSATPAARTRAVVAS